MRVTVALSALCAATAAVAAPSQLVKRAGATGFNWGSEVVRGVNIGGWLVLEPWITPSIFQKYPNSQGIVDEYTLGQNTTYEDANATLTNHWNTWFQYSDMQKISTSGFNLVRIPIGYWAYDNSSSPYLSGAAPYLDTAIGWARNFGIKVLIDLHGVPGSQNGFDNSGQRMATPQWQNVDPGATKTLAILNQIQTKYGDSSYDDVIAGIEVVNEPLTSELNFGDVKQYEQNAFDQQRKTSSSRVVVIQDGFQDPNSYNGWLTPSTGAQNVALDHHEYQVFTDEFVAMLPWQHRQYVCNNAPTYSGADKWTIVGEWTAAMTDCAAALNGYLIGSRYEGTFPGSAPGVGSCATFNFIDQWNQSYIEDTRGYIEAQMETFEKNTQGWIFWNFKTEASAEWDAFRLIDAGIFPQPLTSRNFSQICT